LAGLWRQRHSLQLAVWTSEAILARLSLPPEIPFLAGNEDAEALVQISNAKAEHRVLARSFDWRIPQAFQRRSC
jgi:hypothetical protein